MLQLWVNLPAKHKKLPPKYQSIKNEQISTFKVDEEGSMVRVVAGTFNGVKGPASTFTPIEMYDIRLKSGSGTSFKIPPSHNTFLLVTKGSFKINGSQDVQFKDFVLFENRGDLIELEALGDSYAILLAGEPIDEPIAHYGPFLMNTQEEIRESVELFNAGKFGALE